MKRIILAISSFLYLSTAIGANLHFHYCMGKLAGWGLGYNIEEKCGKCGMEKKATQDSGCCKNEFKHVRLKADQKSPHTIVYQFHVAEVRPLQPFAESSTDLTGRQIYPSLLIPDPPRSSSPCTYICICNFRI
jgi:hypothetical protein